MLGRTAIYPWTEEERLKAEFFGSTPGYFVERGMQKCGGS